MNRLFTGESVDRERSELMIALIPHVIRRPEFTEENLRGIAVGNQASVHLSYGRRPSEMAAEKAAPKAEAPPAAAAAQPPATPSAAVPAGIVPGAPVPAAAPPMPTQPAVGPPATAPPATAPPPTAPPVTAPAAADANPAGTATIQLIPPQAQTTVGGVTTVALAIANASDVSSVPLQFQFDSKVIRLNDVGRGDFLSTDGQVPTFNKNIQNDNGTAIVNMSRPPGVAGSGGSGVLVTLIFQGVAKGTTKVTIPNLSIRNSQGQVVASGSPSFTITVN